ncbi:NAD-dependent epimerase/dehydratase family protein [Halanaerocella petrolearia]
MKKILILGVNGFLGRNLALHYLRQGYHNVIISDIQESDFVNNIDFEFTKLNILNKNKLKQVLLDVDLIYNFVGHAGSLDSFYNYEDNLEINCKGMLNILDIIKDFSKKPMVIFPSSRLIYGQNKNITVEENSPKNPNTIYGIHKLAVENYLKAYNNLFGIPYLIFRISIPYGYYERNLELENHGLINIFIKQILENDVIKIYGKGEQRRDFIHVKDLSQIIYKAVHKEKLINSVFNLGGKEVFSIKDIANIISKIFGGEVEEVEWKQKLSRVETGDMILDSTKLYNEVKFSPNAKFRDYIKNLKTHIKESVW